VGKRGPAPKGEYGRTIGRTAVFSCRLQPDTRARLVSAAKRAGAGGRSLSQELEHRLRRTFIEDDRAVDFYGSEQNEAILQLLGAVIQATGTNWLKKSEEGWVPDTKKDPGEWLRDPKLFDQVLTAVIHTLLWFRPGKERRGQGLYYHSTAEHILDEIRGADPSIPIMKRSGRQHAMALLKDGLGELARRPHLYDEWSKANPPVRIVVNPPAKKRERK
jgi:hypothetical protein